MTLYSEEKEFEGTEIELNNLKALDLLSVIDSLILLCDIPTMFETFTYVLKYFKYYSIV